jgi:hypothetical protein
MKTLFVCDTKLLNKHVGEDYDNYVVVPHNPSAENIKEWADRIKQFVRELWASDSDVDNRKVVITLDAAGPFHVMVFNIKTIMLEDEKIVIDTPNCSINV